MRTRTLVVPMLCLLAAASPDARQKKNTGAPETFTSNIRAVGGGGGAAAATIEIAIQRYTPDADRKSVEEALKTGGYPAFLTALRKAPQVGTVNFGEQKWAIRWAREQPGAKYHRNIVVVTDQPIVFLGGARANAKPRAGYEVGVLQFEVDDVGLGKGTMAGAARVKPGGETGVTIDDYADKPIELQTVTRNLK